MTDNEIIKALEEHIERTETIKYGVRKKTLVDAELLKDTLDLINRQQAEIERLQNLSEKDFEQTAISTVERHRKWIEYRAIKEFAERLCEGRILNDPVVIAVKAELKEMVGDTE